MSDRNEREYNILSTLFADKWIAANPTILTKFENRNFVEPDEGIWVAFSIVAGKVFDAAIGGLIERGIGAAFLQIFMAENVGTIEARILADSFGAIFGLRDFVYSDVVSAGHLWTTRPDMTESPTRSGWRQWRAGIDFYHDQYQTPIVLV